MKKIVLFFSVLSMLAACGNSGGEGDAKNSDTSKPSANEPPKDPEAEKGLQLVAKSDCFQCHKVSEPFQGSPPYEAIAERYKDDDPAVLDTLSQKIIKGGSGRWGTVPMIPHPDLSPDDAKTMVKYVLSLK